MTPPSSCFRLCLPALLALTLGGCASTLGLVTRDDKARPWFGTKTDWYLLTHPAELGRKSVLLPVVACPAAAIDLPFSVVADVVYWPVLSRGQHNRLP